MNLAHTRMRVSVFGKCIFLITAVLSFYQVGQIRGEARFFSAGRGSASAFSFDHFQHDLKR